jgi:hypothetical protein
MTDAGVIVSFLFIYHSLEDKQIVVRSILLMIFHQILGFTLVPLKGRNGFAEDKTSIS